jgi:rhodanese-related sulfurtransferase
MKLVKLHWAPVALALAVTWMALGCSGGHARITSEEAHRLVQAGAQLVDVRASFEFAAGHIPGAINVPVQHIRERVNELQPKDKPTIVYCRSGHRSAVAFDELKAAGFTHLYDLGPMSAW